MNKVQFFYDNDLVALEQKINEWLSFHKEAKVIETNLNSFGKPSQRAGVMSTEKYVFYILYIPGQRRESTTMEKKAEEMASTTAVAHLEAQADMTN